MLFILLEEIELTGGHIEVMLFIEIETIEILCIEIAKLELTGNHIECYL